MAERAVLSVLLCLYRTITFTDPNVGNEMGRCVGDAVSSTGNYSRQMSVFQRTSIYLLAMLSLCFRSHVEVNWFDWLLVIIATAGVGISQWAYATLGQFYTFQLGIRKDHYLITEGPYQYVMHPGYCGQFLLIMSSLLFFRTNILLTLATLVFSVYTFTWRISSEEAMLAKEFKTNWDLYQNVRWHMIPFIW